MKALTVYDESANVLFETDEKGEVANTLKEVGVHYEQWNAGFEIGPEHNEEDILLAYKSEIDKLVEENGYQTRDVISLFSDNPNKAELREKFLSEHTHSEDEVRFFVRGQGLFTLHIEDKVFSILCQKSDLISVPADTLHWFDMGDSPEFTCIRLFNNPSGWVANYSDSGIDKKFPKLN